MRGANIAAPSAAALVARLIWRLSVALHSAYAVEHFTAEETLMREASYPGMQKQVEQHQAFVRKFLELKASYARDGATIAMVLKLNIWLLGWLWKHIRSSDTELGEYLRRHSAAYPGTAGTKAG